jgi:hypothetical protein
MMVKWIIAVAAALVAFTDGVTTRERDRDRDDEGERRGGGRQRMGDGGPPSSSMAGALKAASLMGLSGAALIALYPQQGRGDFLPSSPLFSVPSFFLAKTQLTVMIRQRRCCFRRG